MTATDNLQFVTPIIQHIIASKHGLPNAFGARIPVPTPLNIPAWESKLLDYHDRQIVDFLRYGWPVNYTANQLPISADKNHSSAISYADHVQHYVNTELRYHAIAGPFRTNPFPQPLICCPLQTVPKRGASKRRVVMDLSFPPHASVNIGIPDSSYLNEPYKLRLPGIDRLIEFILQLGQGCLLYKLDLQRAYRQLPIDPKDYHLLGFRFNNLLYFDTRCPFGLKTSAMICQRTTKAVVHCFTQLGFFADVYLDDFYGADSPARASTAFTSLRQLLQELGLQTSPDKDSPPSTKLVCLGINVDSEEMSLSVPPFRVQELLQELSLWSQRSRYTKKQLQSLLGKLSFVTACVKPGRIFMARLLNNLRSFSKSRSSRPISEDMRADISWWSSFLPLFNGVSLIKASSCDFSDFHFATDASLTGGGAICFDECFHFQFSSDILRRASHISSLELYTIVVAVQLWAPKLRHRKFIVSCDNQAAVTVINSGSTKDHFMQRCLRQLWFSAAVFDFELLARHIPGEHNVLADALSRWDSDPSLHAIFQTSARSLDRVYTFQQVPPACLLFQIQ